MARAASTHPPPGWLHGPLTTTGYTEEERLAISHPPTGTPPGSRTRSVMRSSPDAGERGLQTRDSPMPVNHVA